MSKPDLSAVARGVKRVPAALSNGFGRLVNAAADRPVRAVQVLGAVVVALALLAGLFAWQAQRYAAQDGLRAEGIEQAKRSVIKLLSYNFRDIDRQAAETEGLLTGDFKAQYADLLAKDIAPTAKDKQIVVQTQVAVTGVVEESNSELVLLMFVNQDSGSKLKSDSLATGSRIRVTVEREADKWLVSELKPV